MAARKKAWRADSSEAENTFMAVLAGAWVLFGVAVSIGLSYLDAIAPPENPNFWRLCLGVPALVLGFGCLIARRWLMTHRYGVYGFIVIVMLIFTVSLHVTAATWPAMLMATGLVTWVAFFLNRVELVVTLTGVSMIAFSALSWPPPGLGHQFDDARMLVFVPVIWLLGIDLNRQCEDLREARRMIKYRALSDPLTHLGNLRLLRTTVEQQLAAGRAFGIVTLDLDNFKAANDLRGQAGGDAALRLVAERLHATIGRRALVCRPTGDDFAVVIPGSTPETIDETRELLRSAVQSANSQPTADRQIIRGVELSATAGWANFPDDGDSLSGLLSVAEARLVAARAERDEVANTPAHGERRDTAVALTAIGNAPAEPAPDPRSRIAVALSGRSERTWINFIGWGCGWLGMLCALPLLPLTTSEAIGAAAICLAALGYALYRFFRGAGRIDHAPASGVVRFAADVLIGSGIAGLAYLTGGAESPALILAAALVVRMNYVNSHQSHVWRVLYPLIALWSPLIYSNPFTGAGNEYVLTYLGALTGVVVIATTVNEINARRAAEARRRATEFEREDPLTGLVNRSRFNQLIDRLLATGGAEFTLININVDRFGAATGTSGAIATDELMARAAAEVVRVTRAGDEVARTGRTEFSVIARDVGEHAAEELAEVYRNAIRQMADESHADATPCVGYAVRGEDGVSREELFRHATGALSTERHRPNVTLLAI